MNNFSTSPLVKTCLAAVAISLGGIAPAFSVATANVQITFSTADPGVFQYDFSITNTGDENIVIISISDAPRDEDLIGDTIMAPVGFQASYDPGIDPGQGFVDFIEDTSNFAVDTTVSGFSFQSTAAPTTAFNDFSGFSELGNSVDVTTTLVPEPASASLLALGLLTLASRRRR